jgi:hypothetical protein
MGLAARGRRALGLVAALGVTLLAASVTGYALVPPTPVNPGYDISFPQCGGAFPAQPYTVAVVGVNGGRPNTRNPCVGAEYRWARQVVDGKLGLYMNTAYGQSRSGPRTCGGDAGCQAYNYGYGAAVYAHDYAASQGARSATWWLDVETGNRWSGDPRLNAWVVQGAIDGLSAQPDVAGVGAYSTGYQWNRIVGDYRPGIPSWVAGPVSLAGAALSCDPASAFTGGSVALVQYPGGRYDADWAC